MFPFHIIMILLVFFHHHTSHIETHRHFDKFTPSFRLSKTFQMFFPHYGKVRTEMRPRLDSHEIRADFKTGYDVLGDTSLVLSVKYPPAKAVPYLKGLSIYFFIISIYISNTYLYTKLFVTKLFVKFFTNIFVNVIINRRLSKLNKNIQGNRIKF